MWTLIIIIALLIPLIAVVLDSAPARAIAARMEREHPEELSRVDHRIAALESEVERLTGEVERLSEEGAFLHRLLEPRKPDAAGGAGDPDARDVPVEGAAPPPASERRR